MDLPYSEFLFNQLLRHLGHHIECVTYGQEGKEPVCVSVECMDCYKVLTSCDRSDEDE